MSRRDKAGRVDVEGGGNLEHNPFAGLELSGLPEGPKDMPALEKSAEPSPAKKGRVVLRRETAHRGGKVVVVAGDFEARVSNAEIEELARGLRKTCGCGGTVNGREVEIQGDQPGRVAEFLEKQGFRVVGVRS